MVNVFGLFDISGKKVGRTTELPKAEEAIEQLDSRTIAASPIEYDIKLEEVESFFGQSAKVIFSSFLLLSQVNLRYILLTCKYENFAG